MRAFNSNKSDYIVCYIIVLALLYAIMGDYRNSLINNSLENNNTGDSVQQTAAFSNQENASEYDILIDLTESMLYLFKGNEVVKKYVIAQGRPSTPSPIGVWEIVSKARNWGSGFGTRWLGLNVPWGTYGIHGTNKPGSIGHRASQGCFRMRNKDVEELYDIVPYKTKVYVYGGPYGNLGSQLITLSPGDRNSHVLEVQKRLKILGYYNGSIDGIYGEGMKAALLKFKKDKNLPYNHYVDWATYKALGIMAFE